MKLPAPWLPMRGSVASLHSRPYKKFLAEVRAMRRGAALTQDELALRLKKPQSYVTKSERGERRLDLIEWLTLCRACGADPHAFLERVLAVIGQK